MTRFWLIEVRCKDSQYELSSNLEKITFPTGTRIYFDNAAERDRWLRHHPGRTVVMFEEEI